MAWRGMTWHSVAKAHAIISHTMYTLSGARLRVVVGAVGAVCAVCGFVGCGLWFPCLAGAWSPARSCSGAVFRDLCDCDCDRDCMTMRHRQPQPWQAITGRDGETWPGNITHRNHSIAPGCSSTCSSNSWCKSPNRPITTSVPRPWDCLQLVGLPGPWPRPWPWP